MKNSELKNNLISYWKSLGIAERVIDAFKAVKREDFVLKEHKDDAYGDYPLPILEQQTISQPTTIVMMLDALDLKPSDIVLEIGTGSGYNAALLSKLCKKVYTTEYFPSLVDFSKKNLERAKIRNVEVIHSDGSQGLEEKAPFDKIIATAAAPKIPKPWIDQLKEEGLVIAPIGDLWVQRMIKATKKQGKLTMHSLGEFRFVPLKGEYGF